ncbi:MAG: hypothetical protein HWD58_09845 [Bacteroidota bacterium]|nr:MAG: hypothetical protein HWD58_09845 [Bacteroidota bacterium]
MNVTSSSSDEGKFKAPDLHNVALTAPYMHDGRFNTLNEVLDHYSHGIQENKIYPLYSGRMMVQCSV